MLLARSGFVTSYPKFFEYLDALGPDRLYYNEDDNSRPTPDGGHADLPVEARLVERSGLILCASHYLVEQFCRRFPSKGAALFHLPHGVSEAVINPEPHRPARRNVVIVGMLSRRYDWAVIHDVAAALPDVRFEFIGEIDEAGGSGHDEPRGLLERTLALPNVERRPLSTDRDNAMRTWDSAVNWLPYDATLPFNLASCPLKLFTGLASGRPIVSAPIPECQLYPDRVRIYTNAAEAVQMIRCALEPADAAAASRQAEAQVAFASANTWAHRVARFIEILDQQCGTE